MPNRENSGSSPVLGEEKIYPEMVGNIIIQDLTKSPVTQDLPQYPVYFWIGRGDTDSSCF